MLATNVKVRAAIAVALSAAIALAAGDAIGVTAAGAPTGLVTPATHLRAGLMPIVTHQARTASSGTHLDYWGGHVIASVAVVQVLYGSGTYEAQVQSTATPSIASLYQQVTNSSYYDWLSEYNTNVTAQSGKQGTNQTIGRGSFVKQVQISPSSARNGSTIDDAQIQAELQAQVGAGTLPAPDANTLFAVYFPHGKTITMGSKKSGIDFCAFHGTTSSPELYYSVLPDFTTGGMASGCGSGTEFQNVSSVSAHELVEATTDAEVGLAPTIGPPLAWYDYTNGEIGDICNGQQQAITGADGQQYTVQRQWSNAQNACVVSAGTQSNDFSLSLNPTVLTVANGSSGTSQVSTALTSGTAGTVSLSASGMPSGVSVGFNPQSVAPNSGSTMTVSAAAKVVAGTYTVTVTGSEGSVSHTAKLTLSINSGGLVNGNFESGAMSPWTASGATAVVSSGAQAGTYAARVGATGPSATSSVAQTFTAATGATGLTFFYDNVCPDTLSQAWAIAKLKDVTAATTKTVLAKRCAKTPVWTSVSAGLVAGHTYTLTLSNRDDNDPADCAYTLYDSVSVVGTFNRSLIRSF